MPALHPLAFRWDGEHMVPLNPRAADRQYVVGERYHLEHREERSSQSHAHYFAALNEAWQSLPDELAEQFPTEAHLRKFALIRSGFRDERSVIASSKAEALRLAAFVKPMDEYAVVSVSGAAVVVLTAKSQSMRSMGKAEFNRSKDAVLDFVAGLIGSTRDEITRAGESAAA